MTGKDGKRSFLYRLFFKDQAGNSSDAGVGKHPSESHAAHSYEKRLRLLVRTNGTTINLEMTDFPFVIGREQTENGLLIDDKSVSRRHAVVDWQSTEPTIIDVGSSNGVEINDKKLLNGEAQILQRGDFVKIGRAEVCVLDIVYEGCDDIGGDVTIESMGGTEILIPRQPISGLSGSTGWACESCGQNNQDGYMFCTKCGHKRSDLESGTVSIFTPKSDAVFAPEQAHFNTPYGQAGVMSAPPPAPAYSPAPPPVPAPMPPFAPIPASAPLPAYSPAPARMPPFAPTPAPTPAPPPAPATAPIPAGRTFCVMCGHGNREGVKFCVQCGNRLG